MGDGAGSGRAFAMRRLLGRALLPLGVAWGAAGWLLAALLLELHVHRSRALAVATALPAALVVLWFTRRERGGLQGRTLALGALRGGGLLALFVAMVLLFDHPQKDRGAWAIWVPAMTLDFTPSIAASLPKLTLGCALGFLVTYAIVVVRHRRAPFLVAYAWPAIWVAIAFSGFYRATFDALDPAAITAQPGVALLSPSGVRPCGLFAKQCSNRLFPRAMIVDARTRTLFAGFGSTAADLVRGQPMLAAIDVDTGVPQWLDETRHANQVRNLFLDEGQRLLLTAQWGSQEVGIYDMDRRERVAVLPFGRGPDEFQPAAVLADGDRVFVVNIWYPRIVELSRATGKVVREVDLFDRGIAGNGVQLAAAALSRRRGRLWVVIAQPGDTLLELDLDTLEPRRTVDLDVAFPAAFLYDDAAGRAYLSSFRSAAIEVVDVESMRKAGEIDGALGARELAVDPDRGLLFVMDYVHGKALVHSLREGRRLREILVGPKPGGAVVFEGKLYVSSTLGIVEVQLDGQAGAVTRP
jgi:hypothetical protein